VYYKCAAKLKVVSAISFWLIQKSGFND